MGIIQDRLEALRQQGGAPTGTPEDYRARFGITPEPTAPAANSSTWTANQGAVQLDGPKPGVTPKSMLPVPYQAPAAAPAPAANAAPAGFVLDEAKLAEGLKPQPGMISRLAAGVKEAAQASNTLTETGAAKPGKLNALAQVAGAAQAATGAYDLGKNAVTPGSGGSSAAGVDNLFQGAASAINPVVGMIGNLATRGRDIALDKLINTDNPISRRLVGEPGVRPGPALANAAPAPSAVSASSASAADTDTSPVSKAATRGSGGNTSFQVNPSLERIAKEVGVDPGHAHALIMGESSGNPNVKTSSQGAVGLSQILPATFQEMNAKYMSGKGDIKSPEDNMRAGLLYYKDRLAQANGDPGLAAVGYFGGPGAIPKYMAGGSAQDALGTTWDAYRTRFLSSLLGVRQAGYAPATSQPAPMAAEAQPEQNLIQQSAQARLAASPISMVTQGPDSTGADADSGFQKNGITVTMKDGTQKFYGSTAAIPSEVKQYLSLAQQTSAAEEQTPVAVMRGGEPTVYALPGRDIAVAPSVAQSGQVEPYIQKLAQGRMDDANPEAAKRETQIAVAEKQGENQLAVADKQAESHRYGYDKAAETAANTPHLIGQEIVTDPTTMQTKTKGVYGVPVQPGQEAPEYRPLNTEPAGGGIHADPRAIAIKTNKKLSREEKQKQLRALGYS